ncbi:MAG TPA: hypothetical protein VM841_15050 [Actinomycetota bacterium]|nr:hypothetical protein [Actinomycetota bacterium]
MTTHPAGSTKAGLRIRMLAVALSGLAFLPSAGLALPGESHLNEECRHWGVSTDEADVAVDCQDLVDTANVLTLKVTGIDCPALRRGDCHERADRVRNAATGALAPHACGDLGGAATHGCRKTRESTLFAYRLAMGLVFGPIGIVADAFCAGADPTGTAVTSCR